MASPPDCTSLRGEPEAGVATAVVGQPERPIGYGSVAYSALRLRGSARAREWIPQGEKLLGRRKRSREAAGASFAPAGNGDGDPKPAPKA